MSVAANIGFALKTMTSAAQRTIQFLILFMQQTLRENAQRADDTGEGTRVAKEMFRGRCAMRVRAREA
jgi:hypothetical protein